MIVTAEQRKDQADERLRLRCSAERFANVITEGTNCSRFEADVITEKAQEVFHLGEYGDEAVLQPGQMVWQAIDRDEPAGKPLKECRYVRVRLTLLRPAEDREVHREHGTAALRQQQIVRMSEEALQQDALLTVEDLAALLGTNEKTIRCDIARLREKQNITVPTRGTKKDIGPGITHREKVLELYLRGQEPLEISRQLTHSLKAVERYIQSFSRIVFTQSRVRNTHTTALITGTSVHLVGRCLAVRDRWIASPGYQARLEQIERIGTVFWESQDAKKTGMGPEQGGRGHEG
jgi:hypothetical protein